ncbi:uncharacterized protein LOC123216802 isoform X3 [Mangifera indica]|uniref:uncharacterized protein LOC123216802 isoform X2 n=1 Tax=Mangifera indica TaxID=29780 RepID=UPI001CF930D0|nr:uncharacterized protein LOC123216802 isoform X2 [Mangifera indica]XP_044493311.1 uncharacterized protein LOC123216802 isoform X3 [Mangifera indica]
MTGLARPHDRNTLQSLPSNHSHRRNVWHLLALREISPRTKYVPRRQWGEASRLSARGSRNESLRDVKHGLVSWVEAGSLRHLSAKYCPLLPPPRSTIAAAFSPDGRTLASTHGDHTVKILDCQTGNCLKVLSGHRRTPWVVRFHPLRPEILASGSLDHEVRLWDANTSVCIVSRDFYRPIASIAFHAEGELLAVASGHKLYIWPYNNRMEDSKPTVVLKTRRSLRAVHFHPHAAPFLLTAEVNDLDSSDSSMTRATSPGYLRYPPPAVFVANTQSSDHVNLNSKLPPMSMPLLFVPSVSIDNSRMDMDSQHANRHVGSRNMQVESSAAKHFQLHVNVPEQQDTTVSPMETFPVSLPGSFPSTEEPINNSFPNGIESGISDHQGDAMDTDEMQPVEASQRGDSINLDNLSGATMGMPAHISTRSSITEFGQIQRFLPIRDPSCWELPFLQGWLMGQSQAGVPPVLPLSGSSRDHTAQYGGSTSIPHPSTFNVEATVASLAVPGSMNLSAVRGRPKRYHIPHTQFSGSVSGEAASFSNALRDGTDPQPIISRIQSELATSLAAAAAAELPCTVKLRVWSHDIKNPCSPLNGEKCHLTIPHAVLCSEMGAHFSPCGRFLAACVACMLPYSEADPGLQTFVHQEPGTTATSPTRHPISAHQVMYELRIYSLEESTFGSVLVSRAIRAAHCLTSIQFSPTSEHILLAYGRRHGSLLKSIVIDGETSSPIYTVLEVYRVSDMELVRVLPSAEDEVNVACFHPFAGGGLVYGTKEGKLRLLQYDRAPDANCGGPNYFTAENMEEVD